MRGPRERLIEMAANPGRFSEELLVVVEGVQRERGCTFGEAVEKVIRAAEEEHFHEQDARYGGDPSRQALDQTIQRRAASEGVSYAEAAKREMDDLQAAYMEERRQ